MFKIAVFSLNQWALDSAGNKRRILKSVELAREAGASYRTGPELELCGYSVEDAFFDSDTIFRCWSSLLDIIQTTKTWNIIIDIGMPVRFSSLYNCRVLIYMGKILFIRAKTSLAKEGNYREERYFKAWKKGAGVVAYELPQFVANQVCQSHVPFGSDFVLQISSSRLNTHLLVGWEICQELWDLQSVSSELYQNFGCHVIFNGSGSYWELRKLSTVLDLINGVSLRGGACYAFSNLVGCDGQRMVFYGRSCIFEKGKLVAMTPCDSKIFDQVQMITHSIDPKSIDEYRALMAIRPERHDSSGKVWNLNDPPTSVELIDKSYKRFNLNMDLNSKASHDEYVAPINRLENIDIGFQKEIHLYVSLWLWDYLRRSRMKGFMMPLSGGLDSSTVATLVYAMCHHLFLNRKDNDEIISYFKDLHNVDARLIESPEEICKLLLKCSYLSTRYSSSDTQARAEKLSMSIGAQFSLVSLQDIYQRFRNLLEPSVPRSKYTEKIESLPYNDDCSIANDEEVTLLDQNLQARLRMAATYYLSGGNRLVLATGNVDEAIVGYLTKYDCSSADLNPIGGLCKNDLKSYLKFCCTNIYSDKPQLVDCLKSIIDAPPSAELTGSDQRDEDEIGLTYDEISVLGRVRKGIFGCNGPRGSFMTIWNDRHREPFCTMIRCLQALKTKQLDAKESSERLAQLIKLFYNRFSRNRHKTTVLTPALHAETYSPDDNRYDHRQILYPAWSEEFESIDRMVLAIGGGNCDPLLDRLY